MGVALNKKMISEKVLSVKDDSSVSQVLRQTLDRFC